MYCTVFNVYLKSTSYSKIKNRLYVKNAYQVCHYENLLCMIRPLDHDYSD